MMLSEYEFRCMLYEQREIRLANATRKIVAEQRAYLATWRSWKPLPDSPRKLMGAWRVAAVCLAIGCQMAAPPVYAQQGSGMAVLPDGTVLMWDPGTGFAFGPGGTTSWGQGSAFSFGSGGWAIDNNATGIVVPPAYPGAPQFIDPEEGE